MGVKYWNELEISKTRIRTGLTWHRKGRYDDPVKDEYLYQLLYHRVLKGDVSAQSWLKQKRFWLSWKGVVTFMTRENNTRGRGEIQKYDMWGWEGNDVRERDGICVRNVPLKMLLPRERDAGPERSCRHSLTSQRSANPTPPSPTPNTQNYPTASNSK
jgi:hypothetical protein